MAEGGTSLHEAVKSNDFLLCRSLIAGGGNINEINKKGETPLHVAMGEGISMEIVKSVLDAGSVVNARNRVGQTPLHYAASCENLDKMKSLLDVGGTEVNRTDVNGYNVLHSFMRATEEESEEWMTGLRLLVAAGVDVNMQTKFGNTVLHLASNKSNNIDILRSLLLNFPAISCLSQNEHGENFLHSFILRGLDEEANDFFDDFLANRFQSCQHETFIHLLNQRDVYGQTPFYIALDSQELSMTTVQKLIKHGVDVNIQDKLGNTILHRVVALSLGNCEQLVKLLCDAGADLNLQNQNGQSVCSMLQDGDLGVFNILVEHKADLELTDMWKRNLSMVISKFKNVNLLKRTIEVCGANQQRDLFGATSFHYAAFANNVQLLDLLAAGGANRNALDFFGHTPLDISILHQSKDAITSLLGSECTEDLKIYTRVNADKELEKMPEVIYSDSLDGISDILPVPASLSEFAESLLSSRLSSSEDKSEEVKNIQMQVNDFVEGMCVAVSKYDPDFDLSVVPTGSSAEGTKIGTPDEFDFAISLDKFSELCEIIQPNYVEDTSQDSAFACARLVEERRTKELLQYFDENWNLNSWPVLQRLFFLLRRALFENGRSIKGNLYFKYENDLRHLSSKPVFNVTLVWVGGLYKELEISVDLVPALRKKGWWPKYKELSRLRMTEEAKVAGCLLLLQAQNADEESLIICGMDDSVDIFGRQGPSKETDQRTLLRISTAPAEIATMNGYTKIVRDSYMLSKIVVRCTPKLLTNIQSAQEKVALELLGNPRFLDDHFLISADRYISSYMLKNCLFHVVAELEKGSSDITEALQENNIDLPGLTRLIFEHLLHCSDEIFLPSYFLPFVNVFSFEDVEIEKPDPKYVLGKTILRRHRMGMLLKITLHMLGFKRKPEN